MLPSASRLQMAMLCPASWTLRAPDYIAGEAADNGTKLHKVIATHYVTENHIETSELATALGVDADWRVYQGFLPGEDLWGTTNQIFAEIPWAFMAGSPETRILEGAKDRDYSSVLSEEFYGTADLVVVEPDRVHVIDWKTGQGFVPAPENNWQIIATAVWASKHFGKPVVGHIFMLAKGTWEAHLFTDVEISGFDAKLLSLKNTLAKAETKPDFTVGDHCTFCPKFEVCPSQMQMVKLAMAEPTIVRAKDVGDAAMKVMLLKVAVRKAEEQLRMYVDRNGPVTLSDGTVFDVRASSVEAIDPDMASIVVKETGRNPVDFADEVKYTKSRIRRVLGNKPGNALIARLRDAGAIRKVERRVYKVYKKGENEGQAVDSTDSNDDQGS